MLLFLLVIYKPNPSLPLGYRCQYITILLGATLIPSKTTSAYTLIFQTGPESGLTSSTITSPPAEVVVRCGIPVNVPAHLQKPASVVISPYSGLGKAELYFSTLLAPVLEFYSIDYCKNTVTSPAAIKTITDGLPEGTSTVIVLSGDTLIFELLNELPSTKCPTLVLISTGTGYGLASSLYRPLSPDDLIRSALHIFLYGMPYPLPGFIVKFLPGARLLRKAIPLGGTLERQPQITRVISYDVIGGRSP